MAALVLNDHRVKRLRLMVPFQGPWMAEATLDVAADLDDESAVLQVGGATLRGAILQESSGAYLVSTKARIVGGRGGWRKPVIAKAYHNDAGVSVNNVVATTASEVGEAIAVPPTRRLLQVDWERRAARASAVLDELTPDWWIDFDGLTHVESRAIGALPTAAIEVKSFDTLSHVAELRVPEVTDLSPGMLLTGRFTTPLMVRALEFDFADVAKVGAWLG